MLWITMASIKIFFYMYENILKSEENLESETLPVTRFLVRDLQPEYTRSSLCQVDSLLYVSYLHHSVMLIPHRAARTLYSLDVFWIQNLEMSFIILCFRWVHPGRWSQEDLKVIARGLTSGCFLTHCMKIVLWSVFLFEIVRMLFITCSTSRHTHTPQC